MLFILFSMLAIVVVCLLAYKDVIFTVDYQKVDKDSDLDKTTEINSNHKTPGWELKQNLRTLNYISHLEFLYYNKRISEDEFQKYKYLKKQLRVRTLLLARDIKRKKQNLNR